MKRQAKIAISCLYWVWLNISDLGRALVGRPARRFIILYYHSVPTRDRAQFGRQLDLLKRMASVVPAATLEWPGRAPQAAAITFDDAFVSVVENALPELAARNLHCTIFAPSSVLGRQPDWSMEGNSDREEWVVDPAGLKALAGPLVTIGSHSMTHAKLAHIPRDQMRTEVQNSRTTLEGVMGGQVDLFAFPYGDHDDQVIETCRRAGYGRVFTIIPQPVDLSENAYARGRVSVNPDESLLEFALKARGAYAWMPLASKLKRRLLGRKATRPLDVEEQPA